MNFDLHFNEIAKNLGFDISEEIKIGGKYTSLIEHNGLAYISGQIPRIGDTVQIIGRVGDEVDLSQAQLAAQISTIRALAILKQHYGSLNIVEKILQMNVFVHCASTFTQHSEVSDGASEVLYKIFGLELGKHTRTSVGANQLPKNASVEINFIIALNSIKNE
ncbi:RidA family protein [Acinetobacter populi]|uniref:Endoribonuclease L-PSP/chorismate mutase-like domain-containing protein n=1 Tax=Acinetobacter populi TaxID=1582270 RepID=A0A1Z9Z450_9GAMM|nr:RidA family protein [Acinetobacter populi]OUY09207.1 hypothetical protein CAP51_02180 [Acinetobacter populi]